MNKAAVILLVLILAASVFAQGSVWFEGTYDEAKTLAQEKEKLILIDFSSDY
jgi:hypothetical protein